MLLVSSDLELSEIGKVTAKKLPAECMDKSDVRYEIDRIDALMVELLAERHGYVSRMAEIKKDPSEAFAPERIESMVAKRMAQAADLSVPEGQIEMLWRALIDWNIDYERGIINQRLGS